MKKSWGQFFRRVATSCLVTVAGSAAWQSAVCYATVAMDNATDPAYADGWQAGDNGGSGFGAWNFDGTYNSSGQAIDSTSPFNDLGTSWTLFNADGRNPAPNDGNTNSPENGTDVSRAGRAISLGVGSTFKVTVDNPTQRRFFRGYFVRFNDSNGNPGGNICYGGAPCTAGPTPTEEIRIGTFEYFSYGNWQVTVEDSTSLTGLFDTDTAAGGMEIRLTRTGALTYDLVMDPLGAAASHMQSIALFNGEIDWLEFTFFNTDSDFNPVLATPGQGNTDFYVSSMMIVPEPSSAALLLGAGAALGLTRSRRKEN